MSEKIRRQDYVSFKKPIYCPNSCKLGYAKHSASIGDLIRYRLGETEQYFGRVLAAAVRSGIGEAYKPRTVLWVLQLSQSGTHTFPVHVKIEAVLEVRDPSEYGTFVKWFFSSRLPGIETVSAAAYYGALSAHFIDKYLDQDGNLREDWRDAGEANQGASTRGTASVGPDR